MINQSTYSVAVLVVQVYTISTEGLHDMHPRSCDVIRRVIRDSLDLAVGFQVEKVTAVGQSKSNNVWI
jgi:hypothetical protein